MSTKIHLDFITHKSAWREALLFTKLACKDLDDQAYWTHEIKAFDRAYAELEKQLGEDQYNAENSG